MLELQFTIKDIVDRYLTIKNLNTEQKKLTLKAFAHDLLGPYDGIYSSRHTLDMLLKDDSKTSKLQRAYISNFFQIAQTGVQATKELRKLVEKEQTLGIEEYIEEESKKLMESLQLLIEYSPVSEHVLLISDLSDKKRKKLKSLDFSTQELIYIHNITFSKEFKREIYNLEFDLKNYWTRSYEQTDENNIQFFKPGTCALKSSFDYFGKIILPLINNIRAHAFKTENDIYNRLDSAEKYFDIDYNINEDMKQIIVYIRDNGFGIQPEILPHIFEEGVTTKTDSLTTHGLGLYFVKKYVEDNGGAISVESELGKGTKFTFTIPYSKKEHDAYIHDVKVK